jgi:DNA polymerase phi
MGDVDPAFRKRVEEALRAAGMDPEGNGDGDEEDEDDESSDEEIWDDEQMMKVDEHLAKVFRDRKEGNSKQKAKRAYIDCCS